MRIKKKFNNNVILVEDDNGLEQVLIGKAISFDKKIGDEIDANIAEKRGSSNIEMGKKWYENIIFSFIYAIISMKVIY